MLEGLQVLQLWRKKPPDLSGSQAMPTSIKEGILDTDSCEKSILTCWKVGLYVKMGHSCSPPTLRYSGGMASPEGVAILLLFKI